MPDQSGARSANSFHASSGVRYSGQSAPSALAKSTTICQSSRAWPGLVAGEIGRVRARVVQPLDVVLASEGVQAGRLVAQMAGHEGEVRERPDVVDPAGVFGDAQRVKDRGVLHRCVFARGGDDVLGRDARDLLSLLGRVALDDFRDRVEALSVLA